MAMMVLSLIAIFAVGFLMVPQSSRGDKFWISIGGLVVAVVFCFVYPTMMSGRLAASRTNIPLQLVPGTLAIAYLGLNLVFAVIAATAISFNLLATLHVFTLVGLLLLLGGVGLSSIYFSEVDLKDKSEATPKLLLNQRLLTIRDRLSMIEASEILPLKTDFDLFYREQFQYATSESVSGAEQCDIQLNQCLDELERYIDQFEDMDVSQRSGTEPARFEEMPASAQRVLKRLGQALERREQLVGELRN